MARRRISEKQTSFPFLEMERGRHTKPGAGKQCSVVGEVQVCANRASIYAEYEMPAPNMGRAAKVSAYRKSSSIRGGEQCMFAVGGAYVPYQLIDKGIGSKLYTAVAREAGKQGCGLRSDDLRSVFSEAFWRKQKRKGRARCVGREGSYYRMPLMNLQEDCERAKTHPDEVARGVLPTPAACKRMLDPERLPRPSRGGEWPCEFWQLNYPPPDSLAGLKRRRKS